MNFLEKIKAAGMRKMVWGLIALLCVVALCALGKLGDVNSNGTVFRDCFVALCGFVMGANYGEHRAKSGAAAAVPAAGAEPSK
jgi:peptidoglycan/LPS O-acetylase OafA/YrhL